MKSSVLLALLSASSNAITIDKSFINPTPLANLEVPNNFKLHPEYLDPTLAAPTLDDLKDKAEKEIAANNQ